jgi:hypothetical protein
MTPKSCGVVGAKTHMNDINYTSQVHATETNGKGSYREDARGIVTCGVN